jgi:hypothetical protein
MGKQEFEGEFTVTRTEWGSEYGHTGSELKLEGNSHSAFTLLFQVYFKIHPSKLQYCSWLAYYSILKCYTPINYFNIAMG